MAIAKSTGSDAQQDVNIDEHRTRHRRATVQGLEIFYREAGPVDATTLVLLHGFPSASHQYARLMERLSDRFHVIAPDYPGFGYSSAPASSSADGDFAYTFDHLADVTEAFLAALGTDPFFVAKVPGAADQRVRRAVVRERRLADSGTRVRGNADRCPRIECCVRIRIGPRIA